MDNEFLKSKIALAQRELNAASISLQEALKNFYIKCGELNALQKLLNQLEPKLEQYTENQN